MPFVTVTTNVSKERIPDGFVNELTEVVAKPMGKPIEYVWVVLHAGVGMCRYATNDPGAIVEIRAEQFDDKEKNRELMKAVTEFMFNQLKLEPKRISTILTVIDPEKICFGDDILSGK